MQLEVYKDTTGEITTTGCKTDCNEIRIQAGDAVTETTCCKEERCNNVVRPLFGVSQRHSMPFTLVIVSFIVSLSVVRGCR